MSPALGLVLLIISVVLFALLNSMEIALVGSSKVRARHMAEQGSVSAKALVAMQGDQDRFFSATVFVQNALVYVSAFASQALANGLSDNLAIIIAFTLFGVFVTARRVDGPDLECVRTVAQARVEHRVLARTEG